MRILVTGHLGYVGGEPTSVVVRRETIVAAGGFRPQVPKLIDVDAWLRVLRSDGAFVDEELAVRWHHAGSATDEFAGTKNLDKLWVLSDLIRSDELGWPSRLRVLALRLRALACSTKAIVDAPRSQVKQVNGSAANVRYMATGQRLRLKGGADG